MAIEWTGTVSHSFCGQRVAEGEGTAVEGMAFKTEVVAVGKVAERVGQGGEKPQEIGEKKQKTKFNAA